VNRLADLERSVGHEKLELLRRRASRPRPATYPGALSGSDLVLRAKVPNKAEVDVVGAIKKKIKRADAEFADLKENTNADIVFKDEEGTRADRMMTTRLCDALDRLATLVKGEWPSVSLRVTEAWDEDKEHAGQSLHYEGRAADLTTSDKDGGKLGRLARLAVDAGLDWVFFEDEKHIHVSVKRA
jgi:hypothetical protein